MVLDFFMIILTITIFIGASRLLEHVSHKVLNLTETSVSSILVTCFTYVPMFMLGFVIIHEQIDSLPTLALVAAVVIGAIAGQFGFIKVKREAEA